MRRVVHLALLLIVLVSFTISAPARAQEDLSLFEVISQNKDVSMFISALKVFNLDTTLNNKAVGPYTILAPTNAAFKAGLAAMNMTSTQLFADKIKLFKILYAHFIPGWMESFALASVEGRRIATMLWGYAPTVNVSGTEVQLDSASLITTDLRAANGVIHVVDQLIIPDSDAMGMGNKELTWFIQQQKLTKNALQVVTGTRNLKTFTKAVNATDSLASLLADKENLLTIFAPDDAAFGRALQQVNMSADELLGETATINDLMSFHVVPFTYNNETLKTYDGVVLGTIVRNSGLLITVKDETVNLAGSLPLTVTDTIATNGVIHQLGGVVVPQSLFARFGLGGTPTEEPTVEPTTAPTRRPAVTTTPRATIAPTRAATASATSIPTRTVPVEIGEETAEPTATR